MDYEIIATLGPSSDTVPVWRDMLSAGVSAFRLNTSHLSLQQLHPWIDRLGDFFDAEDVRLPLVLDLQGSKWRLGRFTPFQLSDGQTVDLVLGESTEQPQQLPVPHEDFFTAASVSNGEVVLNDARIRLGLVTAGPDSLKARVLQGGSISPHKGLTFTASAYRRESLSAKDQAILDQTRHLGFIRYAISYVKDSVEMSAYREQTGASAHLTAKIERKPAVDEAIQVAESADALWLCRGDLGAELGMKAMAEAVYRFSTLPVRLPVPVLMAGQVFEHLSEHPAPTRSEVCYLYETLIRGYRGVVLSDETAIGHYPVESCRTAAMFRTHMDESRKTKDESEL